MKIKFIVIILFFSFLCINIKFIYAQSDTAKTKIFKIELKNGNELIGTILEKDSSYTIILTPDSLEIKIPNNLILTTEQITDKYFFNEYWYDDPNKTRLFFAPTGRALKAGCGYFSVYEVFFPFIAIGITDWLTFSGGMTLLPGADNQLLYISPKVTPIQYTDFDASLGLLYISVPNKDPPGITYGVGTYGDENAALTLGLGYGFSGASFEKKTIIVLGGEVRVSQSLKMISENWVIPAEETSLLSFGLRFFGESLASDFGFIYSTDNDGDGFPFVPWLGLVYNF